MADETMINYCKKREKQCDIFLTSLSFGLEVCYNAYGFLYWKEVIV
jgi:hypothetical protein